jgi:iron(III) transport system substrate-binding protein
VKSGVTILRTSLVSRKDWNELETLRSRISGPAGGPSPSSQEVNVYSTRSHYGSEPAFELFTKKTGIKVNFFMGNNNEVLERLRAEGKNSPADVMVTVDAGNLWNAAREGLLAAVESETLAKNVPVHLRDPENRWFGLAVRARTIMYSTERVKPAELSTYEGSRTRSGKALPRTPTASTTSPCWRRRSSAWCPQDRRWFVAG